ncbi:MAG: hypothetical protein QM796_03675 [Chthoniobacteraceae bacterium]
MKNNEKLWLTLLRARVIDRTTSTAMKTFTTHILTISGRASACDPVGFRGSGCGLRDANLPAMDRQECAMIDAGNGTIDLAGKACG